MADTKNIYQRINAVMGEVKYVQKQKKQGMRYTIVSHDDVTALLRPHIVSQGIVYYPVHIEQTKDGNRTEIHMVTRFCNMDDPADYIDVHSLGYGIDDQDKGPGKAMSYAIKYALLKTFGLETGDDPDQDQDVEHKPRPKASNLPDVSNDGPQTVHVEDERHGSNPEGRPWQKVNTELGPLWNNTNPYQELAKGVTYDVHIFKGGISRVEN